MFVQYSIVLTQPVSPQMMCLWRLPKAQSLQVCKYGHHDFALTLVLFAIFSFMFWLTGPCVYLVTAKTHEQCRNMLFSSDAVVHAFRRRECVEGHFQFIQSNWKPCGWLRRPGLIAKSNDDNCFSKIVSSFSHCRKTMVSQQVTTSRRPCKPPSCLD